MLARSPLSRGASPPAPFDLHVLSAPLAFILSYDQTLSNVAAFPPEREEGLVVLRPSGRGARREPKCVCRLPKKVFSESRSVSFRLFSPIPGGQPGVGQKGGDAFLCIGC